MHGQKNISLSKYTVRTCYNESTERDKGCVWAVRIAYVCI